MSQIDQLIEKHFGGKTSQACIALAVTKAAISQWRKNGIPELRLHQIQNITRRKRAA